jgi:simple sugar transport system ATP-binding protein
VTIGGRALGRGGPATAGALGLGMVHQHFMLVPTLTVAENVALGHEPRRAWRFDRRAAEARVASTAARFGLAVEPRARVGDLSVGEQQRVEIVKVLSGGARILVLDEPTAVLTPQEVEDLCRILRDLARDGHAVVLISHRLSEVLELADTITVMRAGRVVAQMPAAGANAADLAEKIVGRPLRPPPLRQAHPPGADVLRLEGLCTSGGRSALHEVSLTVRAGEVLGVAGVEGNGQRALLRALLGLEPLLGGRILLDGVDVTRASTAARRAAGIACVPEDRLGEGLIAAMRLDENLLLGRQRDDEFGRHGWLDRGRVRAHARAALAEYEVQPPRGGNQQRLVLAREMGREPRVLALGQPTRGVDVGGIEFLHERILAARAAGCAVLLVSADLAEIRALADRIAVLFEGRVVGLVQAEEMDPRRLGLLMTGGREEKR